MLLTIIVIGVSLGIFLIGWGSGLLEKNEKEEIKKK
jgi:hypothetical protein